ncbi:MAG TPA: universal stress protein, partial [Actinopolymorphaceae bacterium]|nr:universal stress protein [Actinopolymorphaceae bacterium]
EQTVDAIVVGVDGSESSRHALSWAVRHASRTKSQVHAVSVCFVPPISPVVTVPLPPIDSDMLDQGNRDALETAIRQADPDSHGVTVRTSIVYGEPGPALCAVAAGAPALIVGSHGHRAFLATLLGSVSSYCVRHALCPVIVIPPTAQKHNHDSNSAES